VALKRDNAAELPHLVQWAHAGGMDITLIETMPLGVVDEDRTDQFLSLAEGAPRSGVLLDADRPAGCARAARRAMCAWPRPGASWGSSHR
jgi:molybdenum cofactor biosynthesis enzyme MoaA